jgi:hypothetical protein
MTFTGLTTDPTGQSEVICDVLGVIEDIRLKRQAQWRERHHPQGKRFTQDEIRYGPCPTYHNLLSGRSQRLPARQTLLDIADYLECTLAETNEILTTAQYLPQRVELTNQQYHNAIERAKLLMNLLPLPGLIYGYHQEIVAAKDTLLSLNNLPRLEQWQPHQRNPAHWFFDHSLPSHPFYWNTRQLAERTAQGVVEFIYLLGKPHLREPNFAARLNRWRQLPHFAYYWDLVAHGGIQTTDDYGLMWMTTPYMDAPILKRNLLIPMTENQEVVLGIGIPEDGAAHEVFHRLDPRVREIRWDAILADVTR